MTDQAQRYELLERIGVGGMAEVFKARVVGAAGFAKVVAVKRILPTFSSDPDFVGRFIDEAQLTAKLQHPNICQVLDFGVMEGRYFIAMEYVDGLDLAKALSMLDDRGEGLPPDICLAVVGGVLRGLSHAHTAVDDEGQLLGLVHRDVSPHNVLLSVNGDVKLSDFGAAKAKAELRHAHTMDNVALGKLLYMAPEQRRGEQVDPRTDVHGAGILLAEMILGSGTFRRAANELGLDEGLLTDPIAERFPSEVSDRVATILGRATHPRPGVRYADAASMLVDVDACARELVPASTSDRIGGLVRHLKGPAKPSGAIGGKAPAGPRAQGAATAELPDGYQGSGHAGGRTAPSRPRAVITDDHVVTAPDELSTDISGFERTALAQSQEHVARPRGRLTAEGGAAEEIELGSGEILLGTGEIEFEEPSTNVRGSGEVPVDELQTAVVRGRDSQPGPYGVSTGATPTLETLDTQVRRSTDSRPEEAPTRVRSGDGPAGAAMVGPSRDDQATRVRGGGQDAPSVSVDEALTMVKPAGGEEAPTAVHLGSAHELEELQPQVHRGSAGGGADAARPWANPAPAPGAPPPPIEQLRPRSGAPSPPGGAPPPPSDTPPWLIGKDERKGEGLPRPPQGPPAATPEREKHAETAVVRLPSRRRASQARMVILALIVAVPVLILVAWLVTRLFAPPVETPWPPEVTSEQTADVVSPTWPASGGVDAAPATSPTPAEPPPAPPLPPPPAADPTPPPEPPAVTAPPPSPRPAVPSRPPRPPASDRPERGSVTALTIVSDPPGRAYVDGRLVAPRTPVSHFTVSPGSHQIRVVFDSTRQSRSITVRVQPGEHRVVRLTPGG